MWSFYIYIKMKIPLIVGSVIILSCSDLNAKNGSKSDETGFDMINTPLQPVTPKCCCKSNRNNTQNTVNTSNNRSDLNYSGSYISDYVCNCDDFCKCGCCII